MPRRSGLTLIELVTAVAITGLLLAGAMAALGGLARSERLRRAADARRPDTALLETLLEADVVHAEQYRRTGREDGALELKTRLALRAGDMEAEHVRSTVRYEVRLLAGGPWLLRTQETGFARPRTELVAAGIAAIKLAEAGTEGKDPPAGQWLDVPDRSAVTLVRAEGGPVVVEIWKK